LDYDFYFSKLLFTKLVKRGPDGKKKIGEGKFYHFNIRYRLFMLPMKSRGYDI
jgi:hypothetical protein